MSGIAVDHESVYWTSTTSILYRAGTVVKVALGGGTPTTLAAGFLSPSGLAVDAQDAYFVDYEASVVASVGLNGGKVTILSRPPQPLSIVVAGSKLFWTAPTGVAELSAADGSAPVVKDDNTSYGNSISAQALAVGSGSVYWTDWGDVARWDLSSGSVSIVALDQDFPLGIAVDSTYVYWVNQGQNCSDSGVGPCPDTGSIVRAPVVGGAPTTLASKLMSPSYIALDEASIYRTDSVSTVRKMPLQGGSVVTLASKQLFPLAIAVDSTSVYWVNGGGANSMNTGTVVKLTPK